MTKKTWQIILLSLVVLVFVILNLIIPRFGQIQYLQDQISVISKKESSISRTNLEVKYHQPFYEKVKAKASRMDKIMDNSTWEKMILALLRGASLRLNSKSSVALKKGMGVNELKLNLVVDGQYEAQMDFYKSMNGAETQTLLRRYSLKSLEILEKNPHLLGKLELSHFTLGL